MKKPIPDSPLPLRDDNDVAIEPINCVELIIYDNDVLEGCFWRFRFERSNQAIAMIMECFDPEELDEWNFELTNYWKSK